MNLKATKQNTHKHKTNGHWPSPIIQIISFPMFNTFAYAHNRLHSFQFIPPFHSWATNLNLTFTSCCCNCFPISILDASMANIYSKNAPICYRLNYLRRLSMTFMYWLTIALICLFIRIEYLQRTCFSQSILYCRCQLNFLNCTVEYNHVSWSTTNGRNWIHSKSWISVSIRKTSLLERS